jgi:hypothetical protein
METRTITVTLECAGNGRAFLKPRSEGTPWETVSSGAKSEGGSVIATSNFRLSLIRFCDHLPLNR